MGLKYDVISPFAGTIERTWFQSGDRVEEGEIFCTLTVTGKRIDILSPVTGYVDVMEIEQGELVIAGMILASIVLSDVEAENPTSN